MRFTTVVCCLTVACLVSGLPTGSSLHELNAATAYAFALPLVLTNVTTHTVNTDCEGGPVQPQPNRLQHIRNFPTAGHDGAVVRSNVDTLYTVALLDLGGGPVMLSLPPYSGGRYFLWQMMDAWTST